MSTCGWRNKDGIALTGIRQHLFQAGPIGLRAGDDVLKAVFTARFFERAGLEVEALVCRTDPGISNKQLLRSFP
jgi:hypothetical protein